MSEITVYQQVKQYIGIAYPDIEPLVHFDLSGLWTPSHQARNLYGQLNSRGWPDLFIAKPRISVYGANYCGFFLEIKDEGVKIYKKDGSIRKNNHVEEQAIRLAELRQQGYYANFGVGFESCKEQIDAYLREK